MREMLMNKAQEVKRLREEAGVASWYFWFLFNEC